ncbi:hypothetical protein [Microbulbifer variabilis]|uniref:hypothetical protein n=1 Tax=Microbulbifer variabilis TaxID=266805 RepID=UPI001CFCB7B3|nr:hypothetical protein [Microbulbifer variabilis]
MAHRIIWEHALSPQGPPQTLRMHDNETHQAATGTGNIVVEKACAHHISAQSKI